MAFQGKRLKAAREAVDREKLYTIAEAVSLVRANAQAKFDETVEVAMNLGIDPRHADQNVRGGLRERCHFHEQCRSGVGFSRVAATESAAGIGRRFRDAVGYGGWGGPRLRTGC